MSKARIIILTSFQENPPPLLSDRRPKSINPRVALKVTSLTEVLATN